MMTESLVVTHLTTADGFVKNQPKASNSRESDHLYESDRVYESDSLKGKQAWTTNGSLSLLFVLLSAWRNPWRRANSCGSNCGGVDLGSVNSTYIVFFDASCYFLSYSDAISRVTPLFLWLLAPCVQSQPKKFKHVWLTATESLADSSLYSSHTNKFPYQLVMQTVLN